MEQAADDNLSVVSGDEVFDADCDNNIDTRDRLDFVMIQIKKDMWQKVFVVFSRQIQGSCRRETPDLTLDFDFILGLWQ